MTLVLYPAVPAATSLVSVIVVDPCLSTVIQPETIFNMAIYIYDALPASQNFIPFKDSESNFQANPSFCGPKQYTTSDPITSIAPPTSGFPDTDLWTFSAFTNNKLQVGVHSVTINATLVNYPSVPARLVTFTVTVIDNCETAILTS